MWHEPLVFCSSNRCRGLCAAGPCVAWRLRGSGAGRQSVVSGARPASLHEQQRLREWVLLLERPLRLNGTKEESERFDERSADPYTVFTFVNPSLRRMPSMPSAKRRVAVYSMR